MELKSLGECEILNKKIRLKWVHLIEFCQIRTNISTNLAKLPCVSSFYVFKRISWKETIQKERKSNKSWIGWSIWLCSLKCKQNLSCKDVTFFLYILGYLYLNKFHHNSQFHMEGNKDKGVYVRWHYCLYWQRRDWCSSQGMLLWALGFGYIFWWPPIIVVFWWVHFFLFMTELAPIMDWSSLCCCSSSFLYSSFLYKIMNE